MERACNWTHQEKPGKRSFLKEKESMSQRDKKEMMPQGAVRAFPFVSVIVPVYNDAERIGKCIEALLDQTYYPDRYEVLIIDNGSTDETCKVVKKYPVKLLFETEKQSSYAARNKGLAAAKGEMIAFTDSDCIPLKDWIEKGVAHVQRAEGCGLVGGRIEIFVRIPGKPNAVELYDSITGFNQKNDVERQHFGSTANVFTRKRIFDHVGFFNDNLKSGGDNEWGRRVHAFGYHHIYADDTCVGHPARNSFRQLYNRIVRLAGGNYDQRKSNLAFIKAAIRSHRYSVGMIIRTLFRMYPTESLRGIKQRAQFLIALMFVNVVGAYERLRLLFGGRSRR